MTTGFEEYQDLAETGFSSKEPTAPEDEFFHSVYITGRTRKNHINIEEQAGKLQIRGLDYNYYNLDEVYMIFTTVKNILVKTKKVNNRDALDCFSFLSGKPPYFGTSEVSAGKKRQCGQTSAERAADPFCNTCRAQILVAGILCESSGKPIMKTDKETGKNIPAFGFIRARGMKYSNVSNYLAEMYKLELDPVFVPQTDESKEFEKAVVNHKRFITKITKGTASSQYGDQSVFILSRHKELPKNEVKKILALAKNVQGKFVEKFDWSKGRTVTTTGYVPQPSEDQLFETPIKEGEQEEVKQELENSGFKLDEIDF